MTQWQYNAFSRTGHEITGRMRGKKEMVHRHLVEQGFDVVDMKLDYMHSLKHLRLRRNCSAMGLAQFFEDCHNMHMAGMGIAQILESLRATAATQDMADIIAGIEQSMKTGKSFTQAIAHAGIFPWIVPLTIHAGEKSGKLQESFKVLEQYFRRSGDIQGKLSGALIYPSIAFTFLLALMLLLSLYVVPKLHALLPAEASGNVASRVILVLSALMQNYYVAILVMPMAFFAAAYLYRKRCKEDFERWLYRLPVIGDIIKESCMAYYFLNLSVFMKNGIPLLKAIDELNAADPNPVSRKFVECRQCILSGMAFWEALQADAFFSPAVIFTLRRGEEMARVDEYCFNLSEYLNRRVESQMNGFLHLIQPMLLVCGGIFLSLIAFAFLGPIYGSLTKIAGG